MDEALLNQLISEYRETPDHGPSLDAYLKFFQKRKLSEAIERSGFRIDGKVHNHQCLVGREKLELASQLFLRNIEEIKACRSFDELHACITRLAKPISGFGVLARYDISLRIGASLDRWPDVVYLHSGTKKGCKALGVDTRRVFVEKKDLPKPVRVLKPHHAENFLCIFKDKFRKISGIVKACLPGDSTRNRT